MNKFTNLLKVVGGVVGLVSSVLTILELVDKMQHGYKIDYVNLSDEQLDKLAKCIVDEQHTRKLANLEKARAAKTTKNVSETEK